MYISSTNSTNSLVKDAGRGQTGNGWESAPNENLLCSILLPPNKNLYFLNIAVSVAIIRLLGGQYTIKWPNDIYYNDKKLAGILLENAIVGSEIKYSIAGIGLNVNQTEFVSDAPNPVSLKQITGKEYNIDQWMKDLFEAINSVLNEPEELIWSEYKTHLYRREGYWPFEDQEGCFEAHIEDVLPTGEIVLRDKNGQIHQYGFKQIKYIL